jgi:hypothetical protein
VRFWRGLVLMLAALAFGISACGSHAVQLLADDEAAIYGDVTARLCAQARCGPSHPAFVLLEVDTPEARTGVAAQFPDAVFIATTDGLVGPDDQVIEGGRIIHLGQIRPVPDRPGEPIVLVDTYWETSRFEGRGETYVYQVSGDAWLNVDPVTVGITVTTAVP